MSLIKLLCIVFSLVPYVHAGRNYGVRCDLIWNAHDPYCGSNGRCCSKTADRSNCADARLAKHTDGCPTDGWCCVAYPFVEGKENSGGVIDGGYCSDCPKYCTGYGFGTVNRECTCVRTYNHTYVVATCKMHTYGTPCPTFGGAVDCARFCGYQYFSSSSGWDGRKCTCRYKDGSTRAYCHTPTPPPTKFPTKTTLGPTTPLTTARPTTRIVSNPTTSPPSSSNSFSSTLTGSSPTSSFSSDNVDNSVSSSNPKTIDVGLTVVLGLLGLMLFGCVLVVILYLCKKTNYSKGNTGHVATTPAIPTIPITQATRQKKQNTAVQELTVEDMEWS